MAHRKPIGTVCNIGGYDTDREVHEGDVIRTAAKEPSHYRVLSARPVAHKTPRSLQTYHLECVRIGPDDVEEDDRIHPLYWYPRKRSAT